MRKVLMLVLMLTLLLGGGARAALCVRMDADAALLERDGGEIVAPGTYGDIVPLGDGLYAALQGDLYALMDEGGNLRTDFAYGELRRAGNLLIARRDGLWGALDADGNPRSSFVYARIVPDGSGGAWALRAVEDSSFAALWLIPASGEETDAGLRALEAGDGGEGLLPLRLPSGAWGYCDASGEMRIPAAYEYAGDFRDGRAVVVAGGKYGWIDAAGDYVLPPAYDFLEPSPAGYALAAVNLEGVYVFDADGAELASYPGGDVYAAAVGDGYAITDPDGARLFDETGTLLLEADPRAGFYAGIGDQYIVAEGAWGETCVHLLGSENLYQNLYPLGTAGEGALYACMTVNVGRYFNDKLDELQLSADMDSARYGLVDGAGKLLIESGYRSLSALGDDRLLARTDEAWQVIDSRGTIYWQLDAPVEDEGAPF